MRGNNRTREKESTYWKHRTMLGKKAKSKLYALLGISAAILLLVLATALAQGIQSHRLSEIRTVDTDFDMHVYSLNATYLNGTYGRFIDDIGVGTSTPNSALNVEETSTGAATIGASCQANQKYAVALGSGSVSQGQASFTAGTGAYAGGNSAVAMGYQTTAGGHQSFAMGRRANTTGDYSFAMGYGSSAFGDYSAAFGREIIAGGDYSFAVALNDQNFANCSGSNTMCIMGGRVGIGSLAPADTLSVVGTVNATGYQLQPNCADGQVLKWSGGVGQCGTDDTLGGGAVTGDGLSGRVAIWNGTSSINSSSALIWDFDNNKLGISAAAPLSDVSIGGNGRNDAHLYVTGTDLYSVYVDNTLTPGNAYGIYSKATQSSGGGDHFGVYGEASGAGSENYGVYGRASGANHAGVYGTNGSVYGYLGSSGFGAYAYYNSSNIGMLASNQGYGVYGTGSKAAVVGYANPGNTGYLGHVSGRVKYAVYGYYSGSSGMGVYGYNQDYTAIAANGSLIVDRGGVCVAEFGACTSSTAADGDMVIYDGSMCIGQNSCTAPAGDGNLLVETNLTVSNRIGVNTTDPSTSLHLKTGNGGGLNGIGEQITIEDDTGAYLLFDTLSNGRSGIAFTDGALGGNIVYNHANDNITFNTADTDHMVLDKDGNLFVNGNITSGTGTVFIDGTNTRIGVGTKTPSASLDMALYDEPGIRIGNGTTAATGAHSTAIGYDAIASGAYSYARGYDVHAEGDYSTAIGRFNNASGTGAVAIGSNVRARSYYAVALGAGTLADASYTLATGYYSSALKGGSIAMGQRAKADALDSFAWGGDNCGGASDSCNNSRSGVFAIYGGLCTGTEDTKCPDIPDGSAYMNGSVNITDTLYVGDGNDMIGGVFNATHYGVYAQIDSSNDGFGVGVQTLDNSAEGALVRHSTYHGWTGAYGGGPGGGPEGFLGNGTIAVYGSQGSGDYAGFFQGDVNVTGNLSVGFGTVFIDGWNNRIGIGTTTPTAPVEVVGGVDASYGRLLTLRSNSDNSDTSTVLRMQSNDNPLSNGGTVELIANRTNNFLPGRTKLAINIAKSNSEMVNVMNLHADGEVGIGTDSPLGELHIAGDEPELVIGDGEAEHAFIGFYGANWYHMGYNHSSGDFTMGTGGIPTTGDDHLIMESGGLVKIGDGGSATYTGSSGDLLVEDTLEVEGNIYYGGMIIDSTPGSSVATACGTFVPASVCPVGTSSSGPTCDLVGIGAFCEYDGECGGALNEALNNCAGYDWYFRTS